jgi:hypothetical protein
MKAIGAAALAISCSHMLRFHPCPAPARSMHGEPEHAVDAVGWLALLLLPIRHACRNRVRDGTRRSLFMTRCESAWLQADSGKPLRSTVLPRRFYRPIALPNDFGGVGFTG